MNQILAWLFDKLKAANPTIALILGVVLVALFAVLNYLQGAMELPDWLLSVIPWLQGAIVALGLGLNSQTKQFRAMGVMVIMLLASFGLNAQVSIQVNQMPNTRSFYVQMLDNGGKSLGVSSLVRNKAVAEHFAKQLKPKIKTIICWPNPDTVLHELHKTVRYSTDTIYTDFRDTVRWSFRTLKFPTNQSAWQYFYGTYGSQRVITLKTMVAFPAIANEGVLAKNAIEATNYQVARLRQDLADLDAKVQKTKTKYKEDVQAKGFPWYDQVISDCGGTNDGLTSAFWDCVDNSDCFVINTGSNGTKFWTYDYEGITIRGNASSEQAMYNEILQFVELCKNGSIRVEYGTIITSDGIVAFLTNSFAFGEINKASLRANMMQNNKVILYNGLYQKIDNTSTVPRFLNGSRAITTPTFNPKTIAY